MSRRIASLLLPACLGAAWSPAWAQNTLTVPMEVVVVSNPNLVPEGMGDESRRGRATLFRLHPQYTLQSVNGPSRTELTLGGMIERSSNTSLSANRSLPSVGVLWEGRGPVSVFGLRASLAEASTRETQFAEFGRVALDSTQRTALIGATWTRELTSNSDMQLDGFHSRVTYDSSLARDYDETGASARYRRQLTESSRYTLTASTARQRQDRDASGAPPSSIPRTGLVVGYEIELTERMALGANLGVMRTGGIDGRTHTVGGFRLAREDERWTYNLDWGREVRSDGTTSGYTLADTLSVSLGYAFTADTSLTVGASHARALTGVRDAGTLLHARVRTELSPFWAVTAGLENRRARTAGAPYARGYAMTLGLVYTHPDF